MVTLYLVAS